eukprot:scpid107481/ scgid17513/ 
MSQQRSVSLTSAGTWDKCWKLGLWAYNTCAKLQFYTETLNTHLPSLQASTRTVSAAVRPAPCGCSTSQRISVSATAHYPTACVLFIPTSTQSPGASPVWVPGC